MRRIVLLFVSAAWCLWGQGLSFEVASIRPSAPGAGTGGDEGFRDGRYIARNVPLIGIVRAAYGGSDPRDVEVRGPAWMYSARFDIEAKVPAGATGADEQKLLQGLLRDRFRMAVHMETRTKSGFALRLAKGGLKLENIGATRRPGRFLRNPPGSLVSESGMTMKDLAVALARVVEAPVVDTTGQTDLFLVKLEYSPSDLDTGLSGDRTENPLQPSLLTALREQAGLVLEKTTVPVRNVVVDSAEKTPTAN